jgi:hypothetical protein
MLWEQSHEVWRRLGDTAGEIQALGNLGWLELESGDARKGREMIETSLRMAREVGWDWWVALQLRNLAEMALDEGRTEEGRRHARECLQLASVLGDPHQAAYCLALLAWAAAESGDRERAARLWQTVVAQEPAPTRFWLVDREEYAQRMPTEVPTDPPMPLEDAVAYALGEDG